jgi:pimeloyl-ACP methyl ester carboxylesterase
MQQHEVRTADGRRLEVSVGGPSDGRPLIFHTGTPSAGLVFAPLIEQGAERGVRHISYCRPGYGDSDRQAGRTVADCAADVSAIADHFGLDEFFTVGWSGGGPHALACAALLPDRTVAVATIASVAPWEADGIDFLDGMGEENLEEFAAALEGEGPLAAFIEPQGAELAGATGADVAAALGDLITDIDRAALSGDFADYFAEIARGAVRHGPWGWVDDDLAFIRDWGFAVAAITRPVTIWQGAQDRMVPFSHGQWLAGHVSGAQARLIEEEGHISLYAGRYGEILDELLASAPTLT